MATIVTRSGKGSPLTHTEMDSNLTNLNAPAVPTGTGQTNGLLTHQDKSKLDGVANNANNYGHPGGDGNLHVPATSTTNNGKILTAGSTAGSIAWQDAPVSLPTQSDPATVNKYLKSNGSVASWADVAGGGASAFNNLTDGTVSASDPTVTSCEDATPDLAVGHIWVNKTSGEAYVCTNATVANNIWKNIGDGTGNISPNDPPVITGLTVDTTAIASYSWADINTGSTNTYTIAGATDPDGTDSAIVYSIINISNANLTASGGVAGTDNVTLTVGTLSADINGVTFNIRATDEAGGTTDSAQQSINLKAVTSYSVDYLVVAGGAGGTAGNGAGCGGGGAGGYRTSFGTGNISGRLSAVETDLALNASTVYTITVGGGGASCNSSNFASIRDGGTSSITGSDITTVTTTGGGMGGSEGAAYDGRAGGSGGGGAYGANGGEAGGTGTANEGFDGGTSNSYYASSYPASGGGGAGSIGGENASATMGAGGSGLQCNIDNNNYYYAGGGGGGARSGATGGAGGNSVGGNGSSGGNGGNGVANRGSGGGGADQSHTSGAGSSGVVILRMLTTDLGTYTGSPAVATVGLYTVLTYTGVGTYTYTG